MRKFKFKIAHLLLAILLVGLILASFVEQQNVIGESSTLSPDGNWCLKLKLIEYSTLFSSYKRLDAKIEHSTNEKWNVSTSIPFDAADAETIGNQDHDYPVVWSEDSTTVNYWINKELADSISIEVSDGEFKFQRDLYSTTVTHSNLD